MKRSTWTHWNLMAEASRQTMDLRFATTADREAVVSMVVDAAQHQSVPLTPPELALSPAVFHREDGTSVFRPKHPAKYSSTSDHRRRGAAARPGGGHECADGAAAPRRLALRASQDARAASSRRRWRASPPRGGRLDLLVGPAGAGKTTTMRALRSAWIAEHGQGSVVGLAPSAAAAQALADDLGIACDNTAKWLHEYDRGPADAPLRPAA